MSGDRVRHIKFGNGTVTNIAEGGRDYEVTVNFEPSRCEEDVCIICEAGEDGELSETTTSVL